MTVSARMSGALAAALLLAIAPGAAAAPPWRAPATVASSTPLPTGFAPVAAATTGSGRTVVLGATRGGTIASAMRPDETFGSFRRVSRSFEVSPMATDHVSVALPGDRFAVAGTVGSGPERAAVAFGTADGRLGRPQRLPVRAAASTVASLASNAAGDLAAVVRRCEAESCDPARFTLVVRRAGARRWSRPVRVVSAFQATVAVAPGGGVLLVYERRANRGFLARERSPRGRWSAAQRVGPSAFSRHWGPEAHIAPDGTAVVAWGAQRVDDFEPLGDATVWANARPRGGRFGPAQLLSRVANDGRYFVRLTQVRLGSAGDRTTIAYTTSAQSRYAVQTRDLAGARFGEPQTVSPPGRDVILGDLAPLERTAQAVAWVPALPYSTFGAAAPDPAPAGAAVRAPADAAFGPPEAIDVTDPDSVLLRPAAERLLAIFPGDRGFTASLRAPGEAGR